MPPLTKSGLVDEIIALVLQRIQPASDVVSSEGSGGASGDFWGLHGNAGTAPGTDFLGTTDAQDVAFYTNNTERMRIKSDAACVGIGVAPDAGYSLDTLAGIHTQSGNIEAAGDLQAGSNIIASGGAIEAVAGNITAFADLTTSNGNIYALAGFAQIQTSIKGNESGADNDSYIKGSTDDNLFYVDAGADKVGIGVNAPTSKLDIAGDVEITSTLYYYIGDPSTNGSWRIGQGAGVDLLFQRRDAGVWTDHDVGGGHDEVSLDANADTILSLTGQALGLDVQTANRVWAGPATGAPAIPTYRALVEADLCAHDIVSKHSYTGGAALDVFGLSAASTIARLTPSYNPGAAAALLKTHTTGEVILAKFTCSALTSGRVVVAGTAGLLADDAGLLYDAANDQLQLPTSGSGAGLLIGGDTQLYRSAADVLQTPDSLIVDVGLNVGAVSGASAGQIKTAGALLVGATSLTANQMLDVVIADDTGNAGITMRNSDGSILFLNGSGSADRFLPTIKGNAKNAASMGLLLIGNAGTGEDSGTVPLMYFRASVDNAAAVTRPLLGLYNYTTAQAQFDVGGSLRLLGGLYVGSLGTAPTADDIYCDGLISTNGGTTKWELGAYSAGAPSATGYVSVTINGTTYKLLAST